MVCLSGQVFLPCLSPKAHAALWPSRWEGLADSTGANALKHIEMSIPICDTCYLSINSDFQNPHAVRIKLEIDVEGTSSPNGWTPAG